MADKTKYTIKGYINDGEYAIVFTEKNISNIELEFGNGKKMHYNPCEAKLKRIREADKNETCCVECAYAKIKAILDEE